MAINHVLAGIPTNNYAAGLSWYENLFGRPPDVVVKEDEALWQLAERGLVYLVEDRERAGNALLTLMVDDVEQYADADQIETVPGRFRRAVITDPDGNRIALGQELRD